MHAAIDSRRNRIPRNIVFGRAEAASDQYDLRSSDRGANNLRQALAIVADGIFA
jgi:hypothetical protein